MVKIAEREKDERLQELYDSGVDIWSISRLNTIRNCSYEAYLTYVKGERGVSGVYGVMGNRLHQTLEDIVSGKAKKADLLKSVEAELADLEMLNIDFPKDFRGGTSIRDNWIADIMHFCNNFVKPKGKFTTEEMFTYKLDDDNYMIGYIDLIKHYKNKKISIYDWKSSSNFDKERLVEAGRQLVVYALAKEQEGHTIKEVAWIMMKYCEVTFDGKARSNSKNKTKLVKVFNRGKLLKELRTYIESDLLELGYDEVDIEIMLNESVDSNSFKNLPKEIKSKYKVKPYVRKYELTDEVRQETLDYIRDTIDEFNSKNKDDESDWKPREFVNDRGKEDTFFCVCLCNFRGSCPHIKKHNELRSLLNSEDADLF
ncbi:MAG: PD-(D/E)XK nuclease family protein [Anaerovoracaceae bacterium]